jgi:hypothetical protein
MQTFAASAYVHGLEKLSGKTLNYILISGPPLAKCLPDFNPNPIPAHDKTFSTLIPAAGRANFISLESGS